MAIASLPPQKWRVEHEPETCITLMLKVALDTTFAGVNSTGVGLYSRKLVEYLSALGPEKRITLRCFGPSCPSARGRPSLVDTAQEWPVYTQGVLPLALLRFRPDIVHSTSHLGPLLGHGKLVVTVHDLVFRRYPQDYNPVWLAITEALLPHVLRRAAAIIADSEATKADIRRCYGFAARKVKVIYPGINREYAEAPKALDAARQVLARLGIGNDPYILCLGPWVLRKNLRVVVRAFSLIVDELPQVRLVITGDMPRGMKGETPAELVQDLHWQVRERVHLTGYVPTSELTTLISHASLLAYPSRYEGFGLPPLEAMAAGVPVVASRTPAVMEVTGGAALYAAPDSPHEWKEHILQILTSTERAASLRDMGRKRSALFSWERCAEQTANLYEHLSRL